MAKKKGGGKGKGGGKKKAEDGALAKDVNQITELEREIFTNKINDLQSKLDRQVELCKTLQEENNIYQSRYETEVQDKEDIVDYLKRTLQEQAVDIMEYQERLLGQQNTHQIEKDNYEKKLKALGDEYIETKESLTAENMALNGKLALLEEFRLQKDGILAKLAEAEQEVIEQSKKFKNQLRTIEFKNIRDREMLKKEMAERVENLAAEFRKASDKQLSYTVKQAIDETVRVNWQLKKTSDMALNLTEINIKLKERESHLKQQIQIREAVERQLSSKSEGQEKVISLLQGKCQEQKVEMTKFEELKEDYRTLQEVIKQYENELAGAEDEVSCLKIEQKKLEQQIEMIEEELLKQASSNSQLISVIKTAENIIKNEVMAFLSETEDEPPRRDKILQQLLVLLDTSANLEIPASVLSILGKTREDMIESEVNYEDLLLYEPGNLAMLNIEELKEAAHNRSILKSREISGTQVEEIKEHRRKPKRVFDMTAAKILSDIGLLNKFIKDSSEEKSED